MKGEWLPTIGGALWTVTLSVLSGAAVWFAVDRIDTDLASILGLAAAWVGGAGGFYLVGRLSAGRRLWRVFITGLYVWFLICLLLVPALPGFSRGGFALAILVVIAGSAALVAAAAGVGGGLSRIGSGGRTAPRTGPVRGFFTHPTVMIGPPLVLMALLAGAMLWGSHRTEINEQKRRSDMVARWTLRNLATAQEEYYVEFGTYTRNLQVLEERYGFQVRPRIKIEILSMEKESWKARSRSELTGHTFTYDSEDGSLTGP